MQKYWVITRQMIIRTLEFRSEIVVWILLDTIPFLVMFLIWNQLFSQQQTIRGLTLSQTIHYYLLVALISGFISSHFEEWRSDEIRNGKIDFFITRPLSYINEILFKELGGKLVYLAVFIPLYLLFFFASSYFFDVPGLNLGWQQLSLSLMLLGIGYIFSFVLALWIVLGTFWLEGSEGLKHFKWVTEAIFSGSLLPVVFMPDWLQRVVNILPFKYLYAVPIGVIQQTYQFSTGDGLYLFGLIISMIVITSIIWSKALYQYSSVGG